MALCGPTVGEARTHGRAENGVAGGLGENLESLVALYSRATLAYQQATSDRDKVLADALADFIAPAKAVITT